MEVRGPKGPHGDLLRVLRVSWAGPLGISASGEREAPELCLAAVEIIQVAGAADPGTSPLSECCQKLQVDHALGTGGSPERSAAIQSGPSRFSLGSPTLSTRKDRRVSMMSGRV